MIPYIGDISRQDSELLREFAERSESILEFGVGASTQVLAKYGAGKLVTVETAMEWTERTRENLSLLGITKEVDFRDYYKFTPDDKYDFVFDDGADEFRIPFANLVWPHIRVGGYLAFHDTRRQKDVDNVAEFLRTHSPEIYSIEINKNHSNITVIRKKDAVFYINWNETENREPWESGYAPVDMEKFKEKMKNAK